MTTATVTVLLIATRDQFRAAADAGRRRLSLPILVGMLAADVAFGWLLLMAHNGDVGGTSSSLDRFRQVLLGMIGLPGPMHFTEATTSSLVASVLAALGVITGVLFLAMLLARPRRWAAVSYRVVGGVALAAGDPLGDWDRGGRGSTRYNAKFGPQWVPRYPCHPTIPTMPRVAVAALQAEAFLVLPGRHSGRERDATVGDGGAPPALGATSDRDAGAFPATSFGP